MGWHHERERARPDGDGRFLFLGEMEVCDGTGETHPLQCAHELALEREMIYLSVCYIS